MSNKILQGIKGVIFDMDGVLVDSEPAMYKAAIMGLKDYGINAKAEDFKPFVGTGEDSFIGNVVRLHGKEYSIDMKDHVYDIYCKIIKDEIVLFDNIGQILTELKKRGYRLSVASSADRVKVDANIAAAGLPVDLFDCILDGTQVEKLKPDPEIFLKACNGMGLVPEEACVVEDATNGVKAGKAAGMRVLGITSSFSSETLIENGADYTGKDISVLLGE